MSQDSNIIYISDDIIQYILDFTCISCHTCKKKYNLKFYVKQGSFYYCSAECYNHI